MIIAIIILYILTILLAIYGTRKFLEDKYQKKIDDLQDKIDSKENTIDQRDKTIESSQNKNSELEEEIVHLKKSLTEAKEKLSSTIQERNRKVEELTLELQTKSNLLIKEQKKNKELNNERISHLGTISAKEKKIINLENEMQNISEKHKEELAKKDYTINFYKKHLRAPTLKELKDYQFRRKNSSDKYV